MPTSQFPKTVPTRNRLSGPAPPPAHLDEQEQALFRTIVTEFRIDDAGSIELLITACEAHARCRTCREAIDRDGLTVTDRFGCVVPHPLLRSETSARGQYLAALKQLNLEPPQPAKRWMVK
jgi:P27 family predicted phage terminase small subunit